MGVGEERSGRQRENCAQSGRNGHCENRQQAGRLAMTGSKQRYHTKVGRGRVAVEMFVQRRRDTEQGRREERDREQRAEAEST